MSVAAWLCAVLGLLLLCSPFHLPRPSPDEPKGTNQAVAYKSPTMSTSIAGRERAATRMAKPRSPLARRRFEWLGLYLQHTYTRNEQRSVRKRERGIAELYVFVSPACDIAYMKPRER